MHRRRGLLELLLLLISGLILLLMHCSILPFLELLILIPAKEHRVVAMMVMTMVVVAMMSAQEITSALRQMHILLILTSLFIHASATRSLFEVQQFSRIFIHQRVDPASMVCATRAARWHF